MENLNNGAELYAQYNWYKKTFPPVIQAAVDEFFMPGLRLGLIGISKNINPLMEKDAYFVTKVRIDKQHDMFFRSSQGAISLILDRALGKATKRFDLNRMTDLEAKVITAFNDFLFSSVVKLLAPAQPTLKRTNFDVVHLTFCIKDIEANKVSRFIVSLPDELLKPEIVTVEKQHFGNDDFPNSLADVNLTVGTTRFSVLDLKGLDVGDIVVFENSNLKQLQLSVRGFEKDVKLNPNLGLVMPVDNEGEEDMSDNSNTNLWDSLEVEMVGTFDAVKITLGDLKKIEQGMVVDLTSIYDNRVTLSVENKPIARGELVIVNDHYGVKVDEVVAKAPKGVPQAAAVAAADGGAQDFAADGGFPQEEGVPQQAATAGGEEEFDYSDFEMDDDI